MKKIADRPTTWTMVPPWIIIGIALVLAPVLVYSTIDRIDRHRQLMTRSLLDKGESLILSFEAGARAGLGMRWGGFQLQKLLMEMSRQPDIDYLVVTDGEGTIIADSDPSEIGETYGTDLDPAVLSRLSGPAWRRVPRPDGIDTFEVYRPFRPLPENSHFRGFEGWPPVTDGPHPGMPGRNPTFFIFVGIHTGAMETARQAGLRQAIWTGGILLLVGLSGILSLLFAHGYRTTKASLRHARAFSETLVEHMPIGLVARNGQNRIVAVNRAAASILGQPEPALLERNDLLPSPLRRILDGAGEGRPREQDIRVAAQDGRSLLLETIVMPMPEEDGTAGRVLLFRDLTETEALRREVEKNRRLAAVGSLAAGLAHEIRNPLSSLRGFATYFRERHRDHDEDRTAAGIMIQEVDRLNRVVGQLLDFSRPEMPARRPVALEDLVGDSLQLIADQARARKVEIRFDKPPAMGKVQADPDRIRQVLLNLYLNALGAMESGGTLTVRLHAPVEGFARITISDTGAGIRPEDLPRVFDPYFTTKPTGTGLGLPLAQKIMEAHGGGLTLESETGRGTTATITLPGEEKGTK